MAISDVFLQELEQEAHATRRALERVPENKLDWRPHPKSMSLGQLSLHIAVMPGAIAELSTQSPFQMKNFTQEPATSTSQLLSTLDESLVKARQVLKNTDDAALGTMWKMVDGEKEIMAIPRAALLRTVMLNHWYHHRGQLTVYLRELGVPVPSIYGPSADENPFATQPAMSATV
jgi:uncharacterized damage-inducible protein DinB